MSPPSTPRTARRPSLAKTLPSWNRDLHERITALEILRTTDAETTKALLASVAEIKASLQKYQGFWGAVTLIASAIFACFALFKDNLINVFSK